VAISTWQGLPDKPDEVRAREVYTRISPLTIAKRKRNADSERRYSELMAEAEHMRGQGSRLDYTIGANKEKVAALQSQINQLNREIASISQQRSSLMAEAANLESQAGQHGPQPLEPLEEMIQRIHPQDSQMLYAAIAREMKSARALPAPAPTPAHLPGRRPTLGSPATPPQRAALPPPPHELIMQLLAPRR
jgi:predicted  nucleic acid-binding Zn-ribbon protein